MAHTLVLHVTNDEPVVVETERMPEPTDTCIVGSHPRRKDNKEVHYISSEITTVIFPMWRVSFVEVMPAGDEEELFKPFRD